MTTIANSTDGLFPYILLFHCTVPEARGLYKKSGMRLLERCAS